MYYQTFRYVLVIFMEKDTENEANFPELTKKFKQVTFIQVHIINDHKSKLQIRLEFTLNSV